MAATWARLWGGESTSKSFWVPGNGNYLPADVLPTKILG